MQGDKQPKIAWKKINTKGLTVRHGVVISVAYYMSYFTKICNGQSSLSVAFTLLLSDLNFYYPRSQSDFEVINHTAIFSDG